MSKARDYASDLRRFYLPKAGVRARDAWHQAAGRHIQGGRARVGNWRSAKARERGRPDIAARAGDQVRSRTPIMRNRIDRRSGRPNRDARAPMPRTRRRSR